MQKFLVMVIWLVITGILIRYSLFFTFDYDAGNIGPLVMAFTILWLYAFFKRSPGSK